MTKYKGNINQALIELEMMDKIHKNKEDMYKVGKQEVYG